MQPDYARSVAKQHHHVTVSTSPSAESVRRGPHSGLCPPRQSVPAPAAVDLADWAGLAGRRAMNSWLSHAAHAAHAKQALMVNKGIGTSEPQFGLHPPQVQRLFMLHGMRAQVGQVVVHPR